MDKKYLVIEHHKFKTFNDTWTIKFADVDEDTAFTKMVALRALNEDKDKIYYLMPCKHLWTHGLDIKEEIEKINTAQETKQQELL